MLPLSILAALAFFPLAAHQPPSSSESALALPQDPEQIDEYEQRLAEAGDDVEKLWELYNWCTSYGLKKQAKSVAKKIVKIDEDHRKAHEALGHLFYDRQWFTTQRKLDAYKEEEEERKAAEAGLVRWEDQWVDPDDIPFLEQGLVRSSDGDWISAEELEKIEQGWIRQDLEWISPEEAENIDQGLWKCGDNWLSLEDANKYHSRWSRPWRIPVDQFVISTSCERALVDQKMTEVLRSAYGDLIRIYGVRPAQPIEILVLKSMTQYNDFAQEDPFGTSGWFGSYFAIHWIDPEPRYFHGAGVAYWDASTDEGNSWGPHYIRHALGLSYAHGVDGSPKALAKFLKGQGKLNLETFIRERQVPEWYREGAAVYVSRYFLDRSPGVKADWAREWSISNILRGGDLDSASRIIGFDVNAGSAERASRLANEAGLLIAFVLDGKVPALLEAHGALKETLRKGEKPEKAFRALEKAIIEHEAELHAFAGI